MTLSFKLTNSHLCPKLGWTTTGRTNKTKLPLQDSKKNVDWLKYEIFTCKPHLQTYIGC